MNLVNLKIKNFRCYSEETEFVVDNLTAIIGRNDVGKSAILEALDAFFNDKVDQNDLTATSESNDIEITCAFSNIPEKIVLDTSVETSPLEEGILNKNSQLEIKKIFTIGSRKSTATYLIAYHPVNPLLKDLLSKKTGALKAFAEEQGISLENIDKRKNPPIRAAIREKIGGERAITEIKVDGSLDSENNLKAIWGSLKKLLPVYSMFKSDKTFDDKDGDIKNPLQSAIDEALGLQDIREMLEKVEERVKEYSTKIADQTIEKLKDFDKSISEKLKSEFSKDPGYGKIFDLTLLNEKGIPLNKRGSGIRRLVVLSFFQAQAERRKLETNAPSIIYAIEEPETSQHPNHQKMIIDALENLSEQDDIQVLFTTHSANLVREIPKDSLRFISSDQEDEKIAIEYGRDKISGVDNEEVIEKIIKTLGILPNPTDKIRVLVYVEGNNDVTALKKYSDIIHRGENEILNLTQTDTVGYVIAGGSALKHYIDEKHLSGLGKPEVHIYDSDVPEYKTKIDRINAENNPIRKGFITEKLELENYLHPTAITKAYIENGNKDFEMTDITDETDVPLETARIMNLLTNNNWDELEPDKQKDLARLKKKFLNSQAVDKMTVDFLHERNGYAEIKRWLEVIGNFVTN